MLDTELGRNSHWIASSTTFATFSRQPPQRMPAPVARATSRSEAAPFFTARLIWRSDTPRQWQTSMASVPVF